METLEITVLTMAGELLGYCLEECVGVKSHTHEREQRWGQGRGLGDGRRETGGQDRGFRI